MPTSRLALLSVPAIALSLLAGCAQPQPAVTDDPVVAAPSETAAPDPKPTAAMPDSVGPLCFEDFGFSAEQEHHGGTVSWPAPLTPDTLGVEPSCWVDELGSERNLFIAGWYGLDGAQYDAVNGPLEDALAAAGYQLTEDANRISGYRQDLGDGQPISDFRISRTDGYYEVTVMLSGRA
jgi:hypothetical protein